MKQLIVASLILASQFVVAPAALADAKAECEAKAVSKDGKPLAGAAKSSFMKKCMQEATPKEHAECAAKAIGSDGKPLHGAARSAFMKKCVAEAGGAK
ncbi:MAG: hypothetical protein N3C63_02145 [Rhodocyclaceae bacterium]|nr:hypothetical protein [Rhodocyclaceae bacterium]